VVEAADHPHQVTTTTAAAAAAAVAVTITVQHHVQLLHRVRRLLLKGERPLLTTALETQTPVLVRVKDKVKLRR
jgi:cobalamin biosynthesis protein CbiD